MLILFFLLLLLLLHIWFISVRRAYAVSVAERRIEQIKPRICLYHVIIATVNAITIIIAVTITTFISLLLLLLLLLLLEAMASLVDELGEEAGLHLAIVILVVAAQVFDADIQVRDAVGVGELLQPAEEKVSVGEAAVAVRAGPGGLPWGPAHDCRRRQRPQKQRNPNPKP